jgi:hypothetical protein
MAHFARVVDGTVLDIHVVANAVITDDNGVEQEALGQVFLADLHGYDSAELVQCSYNGNFRGAYPGIGYTYDLVADVFVAPGVPYEAV